MHRKRVAAAKKAHEAGVRRQKELLRSLGVPDLSPEEIVARGPLPCKTSDLDRVARAGLSREALRQASRCSPPGQEARARL